MFAIALRYFKAGLDLLKENCWQAHYDLALALHTQAAEGAFLCSDTELAKARDRGLDTDGLQERYARATNRAMADKPADRT